MKFKNQLKFQVVNVTCGIAEVFISYTNPNPNPAMYAEKYTVTEGHPAFLISSVQNQGIVNISMMEYLAQLLDI